MTTPTESPIERIKQKLDIVDEIGAVVALRKSGKAFKGLCPFHGERTPSFYVFPDRQSWHCFGCNEGGDLFTFVMKQQGIEFREALVLLAEKAGIPLAAVGESSAETGEATARKRLRALNEGAAVWFHTQLLQASEAQYARSYLDSRGVSNESIALWRLGYATDNDGLLEYLRGQGYGNDELIEAGLARAREGDGSIYPYFRKRLIFPIRDIRGNTIAFGGRELGGGHPKYLNTPQTILYDKSATLYGLDLARDAVRRADRIILVEGYMDAIVPAQHGTRNIVAVTGSAVTEKHIQQIKKLTRRVTLALDPDAAGESATLRGITVAQQAFDRVQVPIPLPAPKDDKNGRGGRGRFSREQSAQNGQGNQGNERKRQRRDEPRGLVRFEEQVDAEISVMHLPAGVDPDEYVRQDLAGWQRALAEAIPLVDYLIEAQTADLALDTPQGKLEAYRRLLPQFAEIPNRILSTHYADRLAHKLHVDPVEMARALERARKQRPSSPRPSQSQRQPQSSDALDAEEDVAGGQSPAYRTSGNRAGGRPAGAARGQMGEMQAEQQVAEYCVGLLVEQPGLWQEMGAVIGGADFSASDVRAVFEAHGAYLAQLDACGERYAPEAFLASLPDVLRTVAEHARAEVALLFADDEALLPRKAAADAAYRLKRMRLKAEMAEIDFLERDAEQEGDKETMQQLLRRKVELLRLRRMIDSATPIFG